MRGKKMREAGPSYSLSFEISPTTVESGSETFKVGNLTLRLRKFQEELRRSRGNVVLKAPTGAGKTLSLFLLNEENAAGVYPSRALVNDQFSSVKSLLEAGCRKAYERGPLAAFDCEGERYVIAKITSESLEKGGWQRLKELCETIRKERDENFAKSLVFTVPEYPYLLLGGSYKEFERAGIIIKTMLEKKDPREVARVVKEKRDLVAFKGFCAELLFANTLFFDEFHAYSGKALYGALALISIYTALSSYLPVPTRVIISSATETEEFDYAKEMLEDYGLNVVEAREGDEVVRGKTVGQAFFIKSRWPGKAAFAYVEDQLVNMVVNFEDEVKETIKNGKKVAIIVDKVANVYEIYKKVKDWGNTVCMSSLAEELGCGGDPREADIIVGNEALSYGIDIKELELGIITAKTWYQLVQRVGRLGRGSEECKAYLFFPLKMKSSFPTKTSWNGFAEWAKNAYPPKPGSWYKKLKLERKKLEYSLAAYEFTTYLRYRDKFEKSKSIKEMLESARRVLKKFEGDAEVNLNYVATFLFASFRGAGFDVLVKARNFEMNEDWSMNNKPVRGYLAINLNWDTELKRRLESLQGKVIVMRTLWELISDWGANFVQVIGRKVSPPLSVEKLKELNERLLLMDAPVTVVLRGLNFTEDYLRYLIAVEDAIALIEVRGGEPSIKGAVLIA